MQNLVAKATWFPGCVELSYVLLAVLTLTLKCLAVYEQQ